MTGRQLTTCTHGGRPCPRVIQAVPIHRAQAERAGCAPAVAALVVVALLLVLAFAERVVPAIAGALAS